MTEPRIPTDGMMIDQDTTLTPGVYVLPNGLQIAADDITIRADGVTIVSDTKTGVGVRAQGRCRVSVYGLTVNGYAHGIRFDDCADVHLERLTVRNTAEIEGIDTFLYLWQPLDEVYGGAVLLANVRGGAIADCDLQHQMHGVQLYGCQAVTVRGVNASFNSGWGIYLSSTHDSVFEDNRLDFCNRVYRRPESGVVRVEADAAGIVLVNGSSRNQFVRNSCLCGGDGVFIAGYRHPADIQPCSDNLFEDNDCRLSSNNAIEATFSRGNVFRRNDCSDSNYGFWMGFSWENTLEGNIIERCRVIGIAAEHAHDFAIRDNRIRLNGEGVRLWTRGGAVVAYWPGYEVSYDHELTGNLFEGNRIGVVGDTGPETAQTSHDFRLRGNRFVDNRVGARFGRVTGVVLTDNHFERSIEAAVQRAVNADVTTEGNRFEANRADIVEM